MDRLKDNRLKDNLNASAWRSEPDEVISGATAELLAWMKRTNLGAALTVDEVAAEIGCGLCKTMGAHAAVVLARDSADDELELLAATESSTRHLVS